MVEIESYVDPLCNWSLMVEIESYVEPLFIDKRDLKGSLWEGNIIKVG